MRHSVEELEKIIYAYLPKEKGYASRCISAMNYAFCAGGKRIRPLMMLLAYEMYAGEDRAQARPVDCFMAAIEMIHTYSLIHDDLPALDNDDLRRGKPTVHVAYDEVTAILAGDALLNYAFFTAAKAFSLCPGDQKVERALSVLTEKPGLDGMLGGQVLDCELTGKPIGEEELAFIYENKTSALIECALLCGAILGGADDHEITLLETIGSCVGLAFQVRDDILDVEGDAASLGKPIGSDERNDKYTYVTMHGMEAAKAYVSDMTARAMDALSKLSVRDTQAKEELKELLLSLVERDR